MTSFVAYLVAVHLKVVNEIADFGSLFERDVNYVKAFKHFASGSFPKAVDALTAILSENPEGRPLPPPPPPPT